MIIHKCKVKVDLNGSSSTNVKCFQKIYLLIQHNKGKTINENVKDPSLTSYDLSLKCYD